MKNGISNLEAVLMHRDGLTLYEARKRINNVRQMFMDCNYDADKCEQLMYDKLGVELDYLFDIIW